MPRFAATFQALRFGLVGALTALIYFALFAALHEVAGLGLLASICIASAVAIVFNYLGQYSFSFRSARRHRVALGRYAVLMAVLVTGNSIGVGALSSIWLVPPLVAQLAVLPVVALLSFLVQRAYVFGTGK